MISNDTDIDPNNFVDLGYISDIPKSEIFGACLWQMNKALDSPFKSVIKFAYLELLMRGHDTKIRLFSDRMKLLVTYPEKISSEKFKSIEIADVDPYLLLAQEIVSFYENDKTAKKRDEFVRACLFLKTLEGSDYHTKEQEKTARIMSTSKVMEEWNLLPENVESYLNFGNWKFRELVNLGAQVHDYLTDTYKTFRSLFKAFSHETGLTISEHDLSVLGRRLFTFYEKKEHKIDFIKGLARETMRQKKITIHVSRLEGKDHFFAFQGEYDTVSIKENTDSIIKRETHLIRLIVWLMINGILTDRTRLYLAKNYVFFSLADIEKLRDHFFAAFPNVHFSNISSEQLLKNEIIIKALAIINFYKSPAKGSKTLQTSIISMNSYGEFFLQEYTTLTQYKNALTSLLTKHFVSRWNNNLHVYIPDQPEKHYLQNILSS
jgi:adenylate cyclase class 1